MTTLKICIADYEEMRARRSDDEAGRPGPVERRVWFSSAEAFARVLSATNLALLRAIDETAPASLDELARITGKNITTISRTLKTMESYGLVRLERTAAGRVAPRVVHDRVELDLRLTRPVEAPMHA